MAGERGAGSERPFDSAAAAVAGAADAHHAIGGGVGGPGIDEGRAVGAWTVGVAGTGNEIALSEEAFAKLAPEERQRRIRAAADMLRAAGADYVIGDLSELPEVFSQIETRLAQGESPR